MDKSTYLQGFTLHFHFAPNAYFSNTTLKKYYELKLSVDDAEPFDYEGPTVVSSHGSVVPHSQYS